MAGRTVTLVDTGGLVKGPVDDLTRKVSAEAMKAVESAQVIVFVIDARAGLTGTDQHVMEILRASGRPVIPVANEIDSSRQEGFEFDLYRLGMGEVFPVSAEHGRGVTELTEAIVARLPAPQVVTEASGVALAIVGRPNVGKSSLFNRIIRLERSVVSEVAGTTRDPVDAQFTFDGTLFHIVDTAGIRRRTSGAGEVEWVSILKARETLERAEIVLAIVDAVAGIEHQDRALMGMVADSAKPAVLAINKIDLLHLDAGALAKRIEALREGVRFARFVPAVGVSAKTGRGVSPLLTTVTRVLEQSRRRFPTSELNRVLQAVIAEKHPPADGGKPVHFHYVTQAPGPTPRFLVFGNGRKIGPTYLRYMESRFASAFGFPTAR